LQAHTGHRGLKPAAGEYFGRLPDNEQPGFAASLPQPLLPDRPMPGIHITDIEAAINYWREKKPSPDGITLAPELRALAEVYALMIFYHEDEADEKSFPPKALAAWRAWYDTTADTPCIAICSTSQGDALCKGCGRSFDEVQHWPEMSPAEKRATWRRITQEATAWRFGRYADRALENKTAPAADEQA
jgi:predicted Fe-S protein YdhL (DUF1289 family)